MKPEDRVVSGFKHSEAMMRRLQMRAERLAKLSAVSGPTLILVREAVLILEAAMGLDPAECGRALGEFIAGSVRRTAGRCMDLHCEDGEITYGEMHEAYCPECKQRREVEMAEVEKEYEEPEER